MATPSPSMTVRYDEKKLAEYQARVPVLVAEANELMVTDSDAYLAAGAKIDQLEARAKDYNLFFEEPIKQAYNLHRFLTGLRNALTFPLENAVDVLKGRRKTWRRDQDRLDQQRKEAAQRAAKEEYERQAVEQAAQVAHVDEQAAEAILQRAVMAPPPPVSIQSSVPKEDNRTLRKVWKYNLVDAALVKREFLEPSDAKIKAIVQKLGPDAAGIVGGIEVFPDEVESRKGGKKNDE